MSTSEPQTELAPLNRIRVETALSRFPIHRLAKKGQVKIDLLRHTDGVQADLRWKVSYNSDFGQPGPLAYKLDTLIINRRIDELGRPLPELIKIGSLSEVCRALGSRDTGPNITDLKRAFLQNASTFINAKIRYKTKSGRERWGEIGYTRYSVIFTGESLPDGAQADAVYIVLNPPYRDLLNHVEVRPLDYDYLRQLAPGPQRFYELLSFPLYGTLSNERPRAKLIYSDYCLYAPQTRYFDFEHVKKQMYKMHAPHRASGYIGKVEYELIADREGKNDWEIFYTPGPRALIEHQAFARRGGPVIAASAPLSKPALAAPKQQTLALGNPVADPEPLMAELTRRGVTDKKAHELLENAVPGQEVMDQIEWTDAIVAKAPAGKFHNPPGLYVAAIRDNITPPTTFLSSRKRRLQEQARQAKNHQVALHAQQELAYAEYQSQAIEDYLRELPDGQYSQMLREARRQLKHSYNTMSEAQLDELAANWVRADVKNSGRVRVLGFEEFCAGEAVSRTA